MPQNVHGHEIMHIVNDAPKPLTRDELRQVAAERFGPDATFHACSGNGWSLDELLAFLASRGKVVEDPATGHLRTDIGQMCDHGH